MDSNLSKLKAMHEKLDEQTDALYGIAEFSTDGFWDWHIAKDYIYYSPKYWKLLGYDPTKIEPKCSEWHKRIHPDDFKKATEVLFPEHVKTKGEKPYYIKCRYKHGVTGEWVWLICRGKVIRWDESGNPLRMVGTHTLLGDYNGN